MIDVKLEETIKKALEGKCFGNNKVIVETDTLGQVFISGFDEDDYIDPIEVQDLEEEISELESTIKFLKEENEELKRKVEELEEARNELV